MRRSTTTASLSQPSLARQHVALAFGPWLVRLADVGPVAAGFWRLALALPFLFVIAWMTGQPVHWPGRKLALLSLLSPLSSSRPTSPPGTSAST